MRRKLLSHLTPQSSRMVLVAVIVSLVFSAAAMAAAGDLDPTFSGDGKQISNFGAGPSEAAAAVRQADGKIVAVGQADDNFLVARYNLNGTLDTSFSGDGRTQTNFTVSDRAADVARQGDKIVVVGFSTDNNGTGHFAVARYNLNGTLDTSFSGDGKQTTSFGEFGGAASGVAIQANGRIVVVGETGPGFALARYNSNGSLDTSFSGDGRQTTGFGSVGADATDVAIQDDGKIVAVGTAFEPMSSSNFVLARYNPNGTLDTSFSGDGKQGTDFGFSGKASGVVVQDDGKIVAVGTNLDTVNGGSEFALARYNLDGSLDPSFSGDGRQTTGFGTVGADATDVAIQGNGRIVAVGSAGDSSNSQDFALARYNLNGSLDTSFSGDGRQMSEFGGSDRANGVALQGDGRIVAVGGGNGEFALARYLGN
jgi:uncharacterized delta-60 repeat protein